MNNNTGAIQDPMTNCVLFDGYNCIPPGDTFVYASTVGIGLYVIIIPIIHAPRANVVRLSDALKKPIAISNSIYLMYAISALSFLIYAVACFASAYGAIDLVPTFTLFAIGKQVPYSMASSIVGLLCTRLSEIVRKSNNLANNADKHRRSVMEWILVTYAFFGPFLYVIWIIRANGNAVELWIPFGKQLLSECCISILLLLVAEIYLRKNNLTGIPSIQRSRMRLVRLVLVLVVIGLVNVTDVWGALGLIAYPFWVWGVLDVTVVLTLQNAARITSSTTMGGTNRTIRDVSGQKLPSKPAVVPSLPKQSERFGSVLEPSIFDSTIDLGQHTAQPELVYS